jgi:hypothetical protein
MEIHCQVDPRSSNSYRSVFLVSTYFKITFTIRNCKASLWSKEPCFGLIFFLILGHSEWHKMVHAWMSCLSPIFVPWNFRCSPGQPSPTWAIWLCHLVILWLFLVEFLTKYFWVLKLSIHYKMVGFIISFMDE